MEASAVNSPHPDASPDEADLFFGVGEDVPPDPGDFDPVPAPPVMTPEQQRADAEAYHERTGQPVSDSMQTAEQTATIAEAEAEEHQAIVRQEPEPDEL